LSDEDNAAAPGFEAGYRRYRSVPDPSAPAVSATMSGCTWHTVKSQTPVSHQGRPVPISISQHLPPQSPSSGGANPLAALTHQIQMAMVMESHNSGGSLEGPSASQLTEVLLTTVSGISTLRSAIGDHVLAELLALMLKDGKPPRGGSTDPHLPFGLLDN
jgi:hypothetical protein